MECEHERVHMYACWLARLTVGHSCYTVLVSKRYMTELDQYKRIHNFDVITSWSSTNFDLFSVHLCMQTTRYQTMF